MENQNNLQIYAICITIVFVGLLLLVIFRKIGRPLSEAEAIEKIRRRREREEAEAAERAEEVRFLKEQEEAIKNLKPPVLFLSLSNDESGDNLAITVQDGDKKTHLFMLKQRYKMKYYPFFSTLFESVRVPNYYSKVGAVVIPG